MVKVFGFSVTKSNAVLLFIFAGSLVLFGTFGIITVVQTYTQTDTFLTAYFFLYTFMVVIGGYILSRTLKFRDK